MSSRFVAPEDRNKRWEEWHRGEKTISTKSGILVASHGEQVIADILFDNHYAFDYDKLLVFTDEGDEIEPNQTSTFEAEGCRVFWKRPDFRIRGTKIIIEYWGYTRGPGEEETPDTRKYEEHKEQKRAEYDVGDYKLIEVRRQQALLDRTLPREIERLLKAKPEVFPEQIFEKGNSDRGGEDIIEEGKHIENCNRGIHVYPSQDYGDTTEQYCEYCGEPRSYRRGKRK